MKFITFFKTSGTPPIDSKIAAACLTNLSNPAAGLIQSYLQLKDVHALYCLGKSFQYDRSHHPKVRARQNKQEAAHLIFNSVLDEWIQHAQVVVQELNHQHKLFNQYDHVAYYICKLLLMAGSFSQVTYVVNKALFYNEAENKWCKNSDSICVFQMIGIALTVFYICHLISEPVLDALSLFLFEQLKTQQPRNQIEMLAEANELISAYQRIYKCILDINAIDYEHVWKCINTDIRQAYDYLYHERSLTPNEQASMQTIKLLANSIQSIQELRTSRRHLEIDWTPAVVQNSVGWNAFSELDSNLFRPKR